MSILIGMPCYGGQVSDKTVNSLFTLGKVFVRNNIDHGILTIANSSIIHHARSRIANFFINSTEYEYLFFIDSDIGFDANDVIKLYNYREKIVSGAYPMKTVPLRWCYRVHEPRQIRDSLIRIRSNGMGFTLIHRSVFENIANRFGDRLIYKPNQFEHSPITDPGPSYHYFAEMKVDSNFLGEDISFFERVHECGIESWLDTSISLSHVGSHIFAE